MYTYSIITGHRVQKWIAFQSVLEYLLTMPCHFLSWPELFPRNHIMVSHCTFFLFFSVFLLSLINFIIIIIFFFTVLYWFCHTTTCIRHGCTRVPHPEPPSHLPPHTIPLGHPSAPVPSFLYPASNLDWWFISYTILYMF